MGLDAEAQAVEILMMELAFCCTMMDSTRRAAQTTLRK
jgi:hypothetical protein